MFNIDFLFSKAKLQLSNDNSELFNDCPQSFANDSKLSTDDNQLSKDDMQSSKDSVGLFVCNSRLFGDNDKNTPSFIITSPIKLFIKSNISLFQNLLNFFVNNAVIFVK